MCAGMYTHRRESHSSHLLPSSSSRHLEASDSGNEHDHKASNVPLFAHHSRPAPEHSAARQSRHPCQRIACDWSTAVSSAQGPSCWLCILSCFSSRLTLLLLL